MGTTRRTIEQIERSVVKILLNFGSLNFSQLVRKANMQNRHVRLFEEKGLLVVKKVNKQKWYSLA